MLTKLKLIHIILPLFLGVGYIYFILVLNRYFYLSAGLIAVFFIFWFIYALRAYSLLHFRPKFSKNIKELTDLNTEKMFQFKKVDQKLKELKQLIKLNKKHPNIDIRTEYLEFYQQVSYCDLCACSKPPRTYHCFQCNVCVLRREKHSELAGFCIGDGNLKAFMQYMFIGIVISFYMISSLVIVTIEQHHQLNEFTKFELLIFAFEEIALCSCFLLFLKEFMISYFNAKHNITETERQENIMNVQNNPYNQKDFYVELFHSNADYFIISSISDYTQWVDLDQNS